jgi:hypothetical protein
MLNTQTQTQTQSTDTDSRILLGLRHVYMRSPKISPPPYSNAFCIDRSVSLLDPLPDPYCLRDPRVAWMIAPWQLRQVGALVHDRHSYTIASRLAVVVARARGVMSLIYQ